jgi:hypothetical protein
VVNGKQRVGKNTRQNDVREERQDDGQSEKRDNREKNPEKDTLFFQCSLPYAARAPNTAWT